MKTKVSGLVLILGSLYYLIAEAISAAFYNDSLINVYLNYTISELGRPIANSPLFWLMDSAFFIMGLMLLFVNFYKFKDFIIKNKIPFYLFTIIASIGVILVSLVPWGNPETNIIHMVAAIMAVVGGNCLLVVVSKSMAHFDFYQKFTLILGVIGLICSIIMFITVQNFYGPILERIGVYTMIIWFLITGFLLLSDRSEIF